jgi:hypothetical protein
VSFVDDDNWVASDWVARVWQIMRSNPDVGACGGPVEAVCEIPPPDWFWRYHEAYAVGSQFDHDGYVTGRPLRGTGLTIRQNAYFSLHNAGFRSVLMGRTGKALSSGEDSELCFAIELAGWRIWHDSTLRMKHWIPRNRLSWQYLLGLSRGFGQASCILQPYQQTLSDEASIAPVLFWAKMLGVTILGAMRSQLLLADFDLPEGDPRRLNAEVFHGRIRSLIFSAGSCMAACRMARRIAASSQRRGPSGSVLSS